VEGRLNGRGDRGEHEVLGKAREKGEGMMIWKHTGIYYRCSKIIFIFTCIFESFILNWVKNVENWMEIKRSNNSEMKIVYSVLILIIGLIIGVGVALEFIFPEVVINPPLFCTEYLKFLSTIFTILFGWALVHLFWERRIRYKESSKYKIFSQEALKALCDANHYSVESYRDHQRFKSVDEASSNIKSNIDKQRELFKTLKLICERFLINPLADPELYKILISFIEEIKDDFDYFETNQYDQLRKINETMIDKLIKIGDTANRYHTMVEGDLK
jgi:hypothetical protein